SRSRPLARDAIQSLEFPLDNYAAWSSWRWKRFLNPETGGGVWTVNPRYFQNAASQYLFRLAKRYFRSQPFLLSTIFCYIKLKQFEEDILTSSAEGLGMGMTGKDIITSLGLET
ncbi:MAG: V-type ATPase subunit, partial [Treponema sp.]|nr:V-type ATPase subunit [Treponema sp.]